MLDPELKLKLAKAARELADEVDAGNGPQLGFGATFNDDGTPCCAMGHVYHRAGIGRMERRGLDGNLIEVAYPVENSNDAYMPTFRRAGISRQPLPEALRDYALAVEGL